MEGEEERSEKEGSFSKATIPKRIAIVLAGGIVNILFGLLIYFSLTSFGAEHISNTVDSTIEGYGAQIAGIQEQDEIKKIDGKKIRTKTDVNKILKTCEGKELDVEIKRDGNIQTRKVKPTEIKEKSTGIYLAGTSKGEKETQIVKIEENSSSQKAGLQVNDIITKVNGEDVLHNRNKIIEKIQETDENLIFTIQRGEEEKTLTLQPDYVPTYYLGVNFKKAPNTFFQNIYYGFFETSEFAFAIVDNLKMLLTGNVAIDQLMGPVGISSVVAETQGFKEFFNMLALVSLSLGVTNLLPFPPLDGGKVIILFLEAIRRKPLAETVEGSIQMIGFMLLIGLSILVTYHDILRIF